MKIDATLVAMQKGAHLKFLSIFSGYNFAKNEIRMAWKWIEKWHF